MPCFMERFCMACIAASCGALGLSVQCLVQPYESTDKSTEWRIPAHADAELFTLLFQQEGRGPPKPGAPSGCQDAGVYKYAIVKCQAKSLQAVMPPQLMIAYSFDAIVVMLGMYGHQISGCASLLCVQASCNNVMRL